MAHFPHLTFVSASLNRLNPNNWRMFLLPKSIYLRFFHDFPMENPPLIVLLHGFSIVFPIFSIVFHSFPLLFLWKSALFRFVTTPPGRPVGRRGGLGRSGPPQPSRWSGRSCWAPWLGTSRPRRIWSCGGLDQDLYSYIISYVLSIWYGYMCIYIYININI